MDEKKQLRLNWFNKYKQHSLIFNQHHSLEELKIISNNIKNELEEYLHYEIDVVFYIDLEDI
jgi:hypothetical protein